jgi:hypothetical protein
MTVTCCGAKTTRNRMFWLTRSKEMQSGSGSNGSVPDLDAQQMHIQFTYLTILIVLFKKIGRG